MTVKKPRVLIFAPLCYPPAGAEAIITAKLVLAMLDDGWHIKVISQSDFGHTYPISNSKHWAPLLSVVKNITGINDKGLTAQILGRSLTNKLRTLLWVIKAFWVGLRALRKGNYDIVLSRAAPQYGHLPALTVSMLSRIPWIANWSDPMPPQKAPPPYGEGLQAKVSMLSNIYCRAVFRYAAWHTFPCARLMKYYWKMAPELKLKSSVIPHIALSKFCISRDQEKNVFSLCYTGTIGLRDPSSFFEGLKRFLIEYKNHKELKVFFIGEPVVVFRMAAQKHGVSDIVEVEPPNTYDKTLLRAASSSVLFVIEAKCEEGIFFPSKFVDFVQTGRPILAISPPVGTLADILNKYGGGIAVDNHSADEVFYALSKLYIAWTNDSLTEDYGSQRLLNDFCEESILSIYMELFGQLQRKIKAI